MRIRQALRMRKKRPRKYGPSPIVLLLAVASPALISVGGMAADMGVMYMNWSHLQKVTDRAAEIGARSLPGDPGLAEDSAVSYAKHHGLDSTAVSVAINKDDLHITVATEATVPCYFGRMFGLASQKLEAEATAGNKAYANLAERSNKSTLAF